MAEGAKMSGFLGAGSRFDKLERLMKNPAVERITLTITCADNGKFISTLREEGYPARRTLHRCETDTLIDALAEMVVFAIGVDET